MAAGARQLRSIPCLQGSTWADLSLVTHILKNTAPQSQKDALERWSQRAGSGLERDLACDRGTIAHEHCEYVLKTAAKLARQSANKKGSWKVWDDGLARPPKAITNWALKKASEGSPKVAWPAREYARFIRLVGERKRYSDSCIRVQCQQ